MTVQYLRALHSADFPRGREKGKSIASAFVQLLRMQTVHFCKQTKSRFLHFWKGTDANYRIIHATWSLNSHYLVNLSFYAP